MGVAGFFVTGSEPFDQRTRASCALVRALRRAGIDAGAMKPIETGTDGREPTRSERLRRAAGGRDAAEDVCPYPYSRAGAPAGVSREARRPIDLEEIEAAFARIASRRAAVVVEGEGGLLTPIRDDRSSADLAARLGLPLVLAEPRSEGVLERVALGLEASSARGLTVAGLVLCPQPTGRSSAAEWDLAEARRRLGGRVLGEIGDPRAGSIFELGPLLTLLR